MKVLGVDYGRSKIGLAFADGSLAAPLKVIGVSNWEDSLEKVKQAAEVEGVDEIVIGVSEGEMGQEQERFARELASKINLKVNTQEETLSTYEAQLQAREAGIPLQKRKKMEDAYAASIMLQSWLDGQN